MLFFKPETSGERLYYQEVRSSRTGGAHPRGATPSLSRQGRAAGAERRRDTQIDLLNRRALRRKPGDSLGQKKIIRTEMGIGYRLIADHQGSSG